MIVKAGTEHQVSSDFYLFQRKPGGVWQYGFRVNGKPKHRSTKKKDKKAAEKIAMNAWASAKRIQGNKGFDPYTAPSSECFEVYKTRRMKGRDEKDLKIHDDYVARFDGFFKNNPPLSSIGTFEIEDFRDWLSG